MHGLTASAHTCQWLLWLAHSSLGSSSNVMVPQRPCPSVVPMHMASRCSETGTPLPKALRILQGSSAQ